MNNYIICTTTVELWLWGEHVATEKRVERRMANIFIRNGDGSAIKSPLLTWKVNGWCEKHRVDSKSHKNIHFHAESQLFPALRLRILICIFWCLSLFHVFGGRGKEDLPPREGVYVFLFCWRGLFFQKTFFLKKKVTNQMGGVRRWVFLENPQRLESWLTSKSNGWCHSFWHDSRVADPPLSTNNVHIVLRLYFRLRII